MRSFYDAVVGKDFVTAYSLLGSNWQTRTSYESFRKGYMYTLYVTVKNITVISADSQSAQLTAIIEATEDKQNGSTVINSYSVKYMVKSENGVLKIITGKGKKL